MVIKRGDIFFADLRPVVGSEQGGVRPVLIIQNDMGNRHSPTVICAAITSRMNKAKLPTHISLDIKNMILVKTLLFFWSRSEPLINQGFEKRFVIWIRTYCKRSIRLFALV